MKKILITGITGFCGSHLADKYLTMEGIELHGIKKWRSSMDNIKQVEHKIKWHDCNITDAHSVKSVVKEVNPDIIHHLAAMSFVPYSWQYPAETMGVNLIGTINFLEAVREYSPKTIIQVASSSEIYGISDFLPITEDMILRPCSPYGVSKAAMDLTAQQYFKSYGIKTIITRAFNHSGMRRPVDFVCSSFAKQIVDIEKGLKEPIINVGNLSSLRDFTDVRDMVEAYILSVEKCEFGTPYNISSQKSISIQEVLDKLISFSNKNIQVIVDVNRLRPSDLDKLEGDSSKFRKVTGWRNKYSIDRMLEDILNYWREKHGNKTVSP